MGSVGDREIRGESRVQRDQLEQREHENVASYSEFNKALGRSKRTM